MLNVKDFTTEQKAAFVRGWAAAGGYTGDKDAPCPWCAPWCAFDEIDAAGATPEEQGADYWRHCRGEVEKLLKEEQE